MSGDLKGRISWKFAFSSLPGGHFANNQDCLRFMIDGKDQRSTCRPTEQTMMGQLLLSSRVCSSDCGCVWTMMTLVQSDLPDLCRSSREQTNLASPVSRWLGSNPTTLYNRSVCVSFLGTPSARPPNNRSDTGNSSIVRAIGELC